MTRTFTWRRTPHWSDYRLRTCRTMHECVLGPALGTCDGTIRCGEQYRDGGYGRRAHLRCAADPRTVRQDEATTVASGQWLAVAVIEAARERLGGKP